ncbi:TraG family conjugative transposon ATPase, partial [Bacteroides stercoris]
AEQFERIMNDSGFVRLRRLSTDELVGTEKSAGLIERYFSLMPEGDVATDIRYEKLSTDRSDCRLSFASPVGLLLSCNHIY